MVAKIKVIVAGLGEIGLQTCELILQKKSLELLAAVDIDPVKSNKDLGKILKKKNINIKVYNDLKTAVSELKPEVTILTSKSQLNEIANDIFICIEHHSSVISSCEELLFPFEKHKKLSEEIDIKAKENFVHVLGTGVNPGFVMDTLPVFLTSVCKDIQSIKITRVVDLNKRRKNLQTKVGLGLTKSEFNKLVRLQKLGHIGLMESAQFLNYFLKLGAKKFTEKVEPILADRKIKTKYFEINKGDVVGLNHSIIGKSATKKLIELQLIFRADTKEDFDEILIDGTPPINLKIENGISGDLATVAMMVNSIPNLLHARYGLITMKDIIIPSILNV
ncbi:MAG: hypothetical protein WHV63_08565 [Ignavibacteria bacterium]|jgi:4-hydroxy-tetrahydrodipicolinate reductase|nr:hypothetical protein [Ignavibacteria bacterium]MDH7528155.1 hypothetical protein [Ignavibacteria bacterium]NPV10364.1 hypothetical protein [Ignavibacteria bacterium]